MQQGWPCRLCRTEGEYYAEKEPTALDCAVKLLEASPKVKFDAAVSESLARLIKAAIGSIEQPRE